MIYVMVTLYVPNSVPMELFNMWMSATNPSLRRWKQQKSSGEYYEAKRPGVRLDSYTDEYNDVESGVKRGHALWPATRTSPFRNSLLSHLIT